MSLEILTVSVVKVFLWHFFIFFCNVCFLPLPSLSYKKNKNSKLTIHRNSPIRLYSFIGKCFHFVLANWPILNLCKCLFSSNFNSDMQSKRGCGISLVNTGYSKMQKWTIGLIRKQFKILKVSIVFVQPFFWP